MIEQTLQQLTRDDVLRTLKEAGEALPEGERYACLFQGRQYDVKAVIVRALAHTKGLQLPAQKVEDALHKPFVEALESLEFTVVKIPRNLGDTQLPVMIYEIKKPPTVQANYKRLFSANQKRFYWNRDKFAKLKAGDPVFIVNASDGQVLFGYMQDTHIKSDFDAARGISQFTHQSETFEVNGQYDAFVCIDIRKTQHTPGWSWKSLGSEEHTYIAGSDVSADSAASNLQRVNLLMEVFADDEEILLQLHTCYHVVREKLPPAAESNAGLEPRVWYVMQGKRFNPDIGLKYLWAPQSGKGGRQHAHWLAVKDVRPGDIIVHHAEAAIQAISKVISLPQVTPQPKEFNDNWHGEGYQVEVQPLMVFEQPIDSTTIRKRQQQLQWALEAVRGPYNRDGTGNQGYLFEFNWEALALVLADQPVTLPEEIRRWLPDVDTDIKDANSSTAEENTLPPLPSKQTETAPAEWLPQVRAFMAAQGFNYSMAEVANFYLCLRTKPLALLTGISGTGKTQLVRQFAKALGYGNTDYCELVAVRPDWADSSDLLGYSNIQGKFVSQPLLKIMERAIAHPDALYFVILDEMNLARV